ncbi:MAG: condensation domain-containing protein [Actinocatenispora sp.]
MTGAAGVGRVTDPGPVSDPQLQFYFLDQMTTDRREYILGITLVLTGAVDLDRLAAAGRSVVARHESLRFQFVETADGLGRVVLPPDDFEVVRHDLTGVPDGKERLTALYDRVCDHDIVIGGGYLFRMHLVRLAADRTVLMLVMHHIVTDGWSCELMLDEFSQHYRTGRPPEGTPPGYGVYLDWERRCRTGGAWDRDLDYWRRQLRDAPAESTFRRDRRRPAVRTTAAGRMNVDLAPVGSTALRDAAIGHGTSPLVLLVAAVMLVLNRLTAEDDLVVGVATSGRLDADLHELVGLCVNTVPVRCEVVDGTPVASVLDAVRDSLLDAYEHSALPFTRVVEAAGVPHTPSRTPLYQVMVAYHEGTYADCLDIDGVDVAEWELAAPVVQCDATFDVVAQPSGDLSLDISFSTDVFTERAARGWAEECRAVLGELLGGGGPPAP